MIFKLVESNHRFQRVKRSLFGDKTGKIKTFAIISPENPMGIAYSKSANENSVTRFKDILRFGSYSYTQIKGKYGNVEHSFLILNIRLQDAKQIASDFRQESFFFGEVSTDGSVISYYKTPWNAEKALDSKNTNNTMPYDFVDKSEKIVDAESENDFYSKFDIKWRIDMDCFNECLENIDEDDLSESLDDKYTFLGARAYRMKMRKSK